MKGIRGARWWRNGRPVELLVAAEAGTVLLAVGPSNYVALTPPVVQELIATLTRAIEEVRALKDGGGDVIGKQYRATWAEHAAIPAIEHQLILAEREYTEARRYLAWVQAVKTRREQEIAAGSQPGALVDGRLQHTCGGDPASIKDCQACGVAEDKRFERLADR